MTTEDKADFGTVRRMLDKLNASWEPAEAHGAFCGRACLSGAAALQDWLHDVSAGVYRDNDDVVLQESVKGLQTFAAETLLKLEAGQLAFQLLLPDDDTALDVRAAALADWCHGFMHGLSSAGGADQGPFADALESGDVGEIIEDFGQITRAGADADQGNEAEQSYAELEEYVRVSVQLVYEETAGLRQRGTGTP